VEEELPFVVAEDPKRGAVGDYERCFGRIGGESYVLRQRLDVVVADCCCTRFALEQGVDDLVAVEDAAGDAELLELFGEQRDQDCAVALAVGVEETFFEGIKMILKFWFGLAVRSNC
jgi:hypothetical protein